MQVNWAKIGGMLPVVTQSADSGEVLMLAYMDKEALSLTIKTGLAHYFSRTKNRIWRKGEESGNTQKVVSMALDCDGDALLLKVEQKGPACHTGAESCFFNSVGGEDFSGEKMADSDSAKTLAATQNAAIASAAAAATDKAAAAAAADSASTVTATSADSAAPNYSLFDALFHIALDRKLNASPETSYIAKLYKKGENAYLKKICEEAGELALSLKDLTKFELYKDQQKEPFGEHAPGDPAYDAVYEAADLLFHTIIALADHDIHPSRVLDELGRRNGLSGLAEKASRK